MPTELPLDIERRRRRERVARVVAVGMAFVALWLAGIAVYVAVTRDDPPELKHGKGGSDDVKAAPAVPEIHHVAGRDVMRLKHSVEAVIDGVRVTDPALAAALGLQPGDTLLGISGHPLHRELDVSEAIITLQLMTTNTLFVEVQHGTASDRGLAIWMLDIDLRKAALADDTRGSQPSVSPVSDPLVDTITQSDDTHAEMPAATADKITGDPATYLKNARAVPWNTVGSAQAGIKIYAIRVGTVLEAMQVKNGDLIHSVNGTAVASMDDFIREIVASRGSDEWRLDIERRHAAMMLVITIR